MDAEAGRILIRLAHDQPFYDNIDNTPLTLKLADDDNISSSSSEGSTVSNNNSHSMSISSLLDAHSPSTPALVSPPNSALTGIPKRSRSSEYSNPVTTEKNESSATPGHFSSKRKWQSPFEPHGQSTTVSEGYPDDSYPRKRYQTDSLLSGKDSYTEAYQERSHSPLQLTPSYATRDSAPSAANQNTVYNHLPGVYNRDMIASEYQSSISPNHPTSSIPPERPWYSSTSLPTAPADPSASSIMARPLTAFLWNDASSMNHTKRRETTTMLPPLALAPLH
ncbi:uncharacterized protein BYT42DRAFT_620837 [Radiomyces spectabilis]|uniref:uncharacterized protein n=1 Tax=Radiomyces spectabilis TaxID=64574 RepID=UPI00221EC2C5|nr:uncharacterized protein BYT42DRAFT_620837 [Radiomyces spectabilis]KAI8394285.1 hypothetical protein BYT42DRAFT_620837 [Radiomyces spectabilis]